MKNIIKLALVGITLFTVNINAETLKSFVKKENHAHTSVNTNPFYQGEIVSVLQAQAYTYLEIKESTNLTFWVATTAVEANIGDFVRFQKELVTKNFKSKTLDRVFKELMFVSSLQYRTK